jgi:uncharacterized surface anchored protein
MRKMEEKGGEGIDEVIALDTIEVGRKTFSLARCVCPNVNLRHEESTSKVLMDEKKTFLFSLAVKPHQPNKADKVSTTSGESQRKTARKENQATKDSESKKREDLTSLGSDDSGSFTKRLLTRGKSPNKAVAPFRYPLRV